MATQQGWILRVGDGAATEVFTAIGGLYEVPEFTPFQRTLRDATDIAHASTSNMQKKEFNQQMEGAELPISFDRDTTDVAQNRLQDQEGDNTGVRIQYEWTDGTVTETWTMTVLASDWTYDSSASNDPSAKDRINLKLTVHDTVPVMT